MNKPFIEPGDLKLNKDYFVGKKKKKSKFAIGKKYGYLDYFKEQIIKEYRNVCLDCGFEKGEHSETCIKYK